MASGLSGWRGASRPGEPAMSDDRRRTLFMLLGLTGLAFALRVIQLDGQSLWRDEVDAIRFATQPLPDLLAMFRKPGENGPLFFLGLRPWLAVAGQSEFALRFPSALAGTLAVPTLYVLVRRLTAGFGRTAGRGRVSTAIALVAALLMATAPYLVWYGQEAKMYALLSALGASDTVIGVRRGPAGWRLALGRPVCVDRFELLRSPAGGAGHPAAGSLAADPAGRAARTYPPAPVSIVSGGAGPSISAARFLADRLMAGAADPCGPAGRCVVRHFQGVRRGLQPGHFAGTAASHPVAGHVGTAVGARAMDRQAAEAPGFSP